VLLQNQGTDSEGIPQFLDVGMATGADDILDSRGLALADFDNDGDLDIAINHNEGDVGGEDGVPVTLLRNDLGNNRSWLAVELVGAATSDAAAGGAQASNRDGIGSLVRIESGDMRQLRVVKAGSSYASQSSGRVYFGLGDLTGVDSLTVRWPTGRQQRFGAIAAGQVIRIREGVDEVEVVRD